MQKGAITMENKRNTGNEPQFYWQAPAEGLDPQAPEAPSEIHIQSHLESTHADALAAYLRHVRTSETLDYAEEEFNSLYRGSYARVEDFAEDYTESLGWSSALEYFTYAERIPSGLVAWSMPALLEVLRAEYQIIEYGGGIHVFYR